MGGRHLRAHLFGMLLFLVWGVHSVRGQAGISLAQLNGTIMDESGGTVAKANVTLREVDTNRTYTAVSTDNGYYVVPNLTPGRYELKVDFAGFAPYTQQESCCASARPPRLT